MAHDIVNDDGVDFLLISEVVGGYDQEVGACRVTGDICQRRMLEVRLFVVDLVRHGRSKSDKAVSSVTKMNRVIKMSLLKL